MNDRFHGDEPYIAAERNRTADFGCRPYLTPREQLEAKHEALRMMVAEIKQASAKVTKGSKVDYTELAGGILDHAEAICEAIEYFVEAA